MFYIFPFMGFQYADPTLQMDRNQNEVICLSAVPISSIPADHQNEAPLSTSASPGTFGTKESYRCHKCTMTFEEKDNLLLHLLSSHKKSRTTRYDAANSDSVIMKDGKYECQLCHKLFEEKNRFSSHFGNHIKDYVKRVESSGETNRVHRRTQKVQEMISAERVSAAVLNNNEAVEKSTPGFPHAKIESEALSKTQPSSDVYHAKIPTIEPVVVSEKNEDGVADYTEKQEINADLSNDNVEVVDEAGKINADLDLSKDMTVVSSIACKNGTSEMPEKINVSENENKASMDSASSMEDCRQGRVPAIGVFAPQENNNSINNETLVNSLFGSPMEDMDVDDGDEVGDNVLIPEIEDQCFGLEEGSLNSRMQQISSEGCSLIQFGREGNCNYSDDLNGPQTSVLENECGSENHKSSSGQVLSLNDNQNKVIGETLAERGSYNSWNGEKANDFIQNVAERTVRESDTSLPVIPTVDQQTCSFDVKGFSGSEVQNPWQQKDFEGNLVSVHQKPLSPDANIGKCSYGTMRNFQSFAESQSDSAVLNHVEKGRSSGGTLPVAPPDQQAFVLNTHEARGPTFSEPKEYRGFSGLYAGQRNCVDKNSGSLTVSNAVDDRKKEQLMSSNWNNKSSFGFDSQCALQRGGPVTGFEAWANPPPRSSEAVASEHRGATFFGSVVEESKQNKESAFGLPFPGVDHQQASATSYNLDMFYGGAMPDNCRAGNVGSFRINERMIGLYNQQQPKPCEEAMTPSMSREEQNATILHHSSLNYAPPSAAQPSVCFPAFNMVSDKVIYFVLVLHASMRKKERL